MLLKFPGNEALAASYIDKAVALDTLEANKMEYITSVANNYFAAKNYNEAGRMVRQNFTLKKRLQKQIFIMQDITIIRAGNYKTADSIFNIYQQKYPEDILGWYIWSYCQSK